MVFARIAQAAAYAPEQVITNDDLSAIMDTSDEWISSRTGIRRRHITRNETTSDLGTQVAKQLISKAGLSAEDIDFIIVATITPDSLMPSTAARIQANVGAVNAFAMVASAACSGFVFALATADKFIQSGMYKRGIVIGAETLSKTLDWSERSSSVLFGDGAGGVLIEASETKHFLAESLHATGSRGFSLTSGKVGLSSPFSEEETDDKFLKMDGRAIFDFAIRDVSKSIKALIEASDVAAEDLDYLFLHQANIRILDKIAKKIGVDVDKLPANMMEYGNTSAASVPILLSEYVDKGYIKLDGSQTVLFSAFGGGLTWGSLIVKI
ncbi:3-oxoacyl-[acyl-carrier-protein] synthase 3 [Streptococcus pasteurianus]|nr:3-oxoacyl-[acyl-carrier-protein] synthase 3 [Streptococcus pasteurianus]